MPTPICFMVMPFRTKDTGAAPPAPGKVDFDALYHGDVLVEGDTSEQFPDLATAV